MENQGFVLSQVDLHERMVLATSLNKAFSAAGGAIVTANREWHERILHTGGPLLFSGPIQPPNHRIGQTPFVRSVE